MPQPPNPTSAAHIESVRAATTGTAAGPGELRRGRASRATTAQLSQSPTAGATATAGAPATAAANTAAVLAMAAAAIAATTTATVATGGDH